MRHGCEPSPPFSHAVSSGGRDLQTYRALQFETLQHHPPRCAQSQSGEPLHSSKGSRAQGSERLGGGLVVPPSLGRRSSPSAWDEHRGKSLASQAPPWILDPLHLRLLHIPPPSPSTSHLHSHSLHFSTTRSIPPCSAHLVHPVLLLDHPLTIDATDLPIRHIY